MISKLSVLACVNLCLHCRWGTGTSMLVTLSCVSRDGWLEPWLVLSLIKAVRRHLWIIYCDFTVVTTHVMCAVHSIIPQRLFSPWTQDFASQSCVLISRVFFWWDPRTINPDSAGDEVTDCQPESCQRRTVKWAWPNECTAVLQLVVGFSVCWNTEDMLFIFMCYVHYLCKIAHKALLRAFKEVNFGQNNDSEL